MCKMEGCNHKTRLSASDTHHIGQSWYDHGICSCCALELVNQKLIEDKGYRFSGMCNKRNNSTEL